MALAEKPAPETSPLLQTPHLDHDDPQEKVRLNLVVNHQVRERIERLRKLTEAASITEVIRRALAYYETLLEVREEGAKLVIETDSEREILRII